MINFRVTYKRNGEERIAPFIFSNISEARQARNLYTNRGYEDVSILAQRIEDNINP